MKRIALIFSMMFISTVSFAQTKPKTMRELRDSIFTVMKLSDENRQKMHDLIAENGKGQKAIKQDLTITFGKKRKNSMLGTKKWPLKKKQF